MEGSICNAFLVKRHPIFVHIIFSLMCIQEFRKCLVMIMAVMVMRSKGHFRYLNIPIDHMDDKNLGGYLIVSMRLHELMFC